VAVRCGAGRAESIRLSGASHLVLQGTGGDEFTDVHYFGGARRDHCPSMLEGGHVVARDWKTGNLVSAELT
jgi:hypothetical protein